MKPDWKNAPAWAEYLAQDRQGVWWWYECAPAKGTTAWWPVEGQSGACQWYEDEPAHVVSSPQQDRPQGRNDDWQSTLEERQ